MPEMTIRERLVKLLLTLAQRICPHQSGRYEFWSTRCNACHSRNVAQTCGSLPDNSITSVEP